MIFLTLLLVPFFVSTLFFFLGKQKISWREFLMHVGAALLVAGCSAGIMHCQNTSDTETLNGYVTNKAPVRVSCEHSYCCQRCENCSTDSKGRRSCTTYCCRTCYDHSYDISWRVYTTVGDLRIQRIDRQGLREPPRWTAVYAGEPTSMSHNYTNYIKASPDSLFRQQGSLEAYEKYLPEYPGKIYDYYRIDRFVNVGTRVSSGDVRAWNVELSKLNAVVGGKYQVNVIVVVTTLDVKFFQALRQHWLGGKKNDAIVVLGLSDDAAKIVWARVMSWSQHDVFNTGLRTRLLELQFNRDDIVTAIKSNIESSFKRKPMADFEYLKSSVAPTGTQFAIALIINLVVSLGLGVVFLKNDF